MPRKYLKEYTCLYLKMFSLSLFLNETTFFFFNQNKHSRPHLNPLLNRVDSISTVLFEMVKSCGYLYYDIGVG